eukprot:GHVP01069544.1.p1 GENE.GHVP01069544.1~~GHVP01069544.1.p1  ORF type:complete len:228 (+),score=42.12 GHVP01069544.1:24-707(+)
MEDIIERYIKIVLDDTPKERFVLPGDLISEDSQNIQGHGTYKKEGKIYSLLAGKVRQTNMVLQVTPPPHKYIPQIGDVVVGRVLDIQKKRWRIEINSIKDAILKLSAINLPGDIQRKKLESDEIEMRKLITIGDIVIGEVQEKHSDGSCSIHTRNNKYGKTGYGIIIKMDYNRIRNLETHFTELENGTEVVIGINGYIWIETGPDITQTSIKQIQTLYNLSNRFDKY